MNFWQQFALSQAVSALHAVIRTYGAKYFTPDELSASDVLIESLLDLPRRIHENQLAPKLKVASK